jgi:hypothetical protein
MCRSLWDQFRGEAVRRLLALDAEVFDIYRNWLYTTTISVTSDDICEVSFRRLLKA